MRICVLQLCTVFTFLALSTKTNADSFWNDITIAPTAAFQYKWLSFNQDYPNGISDSVDGALKGGMNAHIPMFNVGLTFIFQSKAYLAIKTEQTLGNPSEKSDVPFTNPLIGPIYKVNSAITREDSSILIGYRVDKRINLFAGYMQGQTVINPSPFTSPESQINLTQDQLNNGQPEYQQDYDEDGLFAGILYLLPVQQYGSISFSLAYAQMDGQYKDNHFETPFNFQGDSTGISYGMTWASGLTDQITYFIDFRFQAYEMKGVDKTGNFPDKTVTTEEEMTSLSAGLQWRFSNLF